MGDHQLPDTGIFRKAGRQFSGKVRFLLRPDGSREQPVRQEQIAAAIVFRKGREGIGVTGVAEGLSFTGNPEADRGDRMAGGVYGDLRTAGRQVIARFQDL